MNLDAVTAVKPEERSEIKHAIGVFNAYADKFMWDRYGEDPPRVPYKVYSSVLWESSGGSALPLLLKDSKVIVKMEAPE